jgi:DNA-binding response OmpR family regulator
MTGIGEPGAVPRPRRILLAEDDVHLRSFLSSILTSDGYEVVEAADGEILGDYLANRFLRGPDRSPPVDLIVADVRMPGLSGLEVLGEFRRADRTTPFVLVTAFGTEELHAHARMLGAEAVLDKPFEIDDLRMIVRLLAPIDSSEVRIVPAESSKSGVGPAERPPQSDAPAAKPAGSC